MSVENCPVCLKKWDATHIKYGECPKAEEKAIERGEEIGRLYKAFRFRERKVKEQGKEIERLKGLLRMLVGKKQKKHFNRKDADELQECYREIERELQENPGPEPVEDGGCLCQGCGRHYKVDIVVSDELWKLIKPNDKPDEGGLLCGGCIADRIEQFGKYDVYELEKGADR